MSRSIDHFSGEPTVVISAVSNSMKAGLRLETGGGRNGAAFVEDLEHRLARRRVPPRISPTLARIRQVIPAPQAQLHELFPHVLHHGVARPSH